MAWSFNPFTGNLDLTGSSGAVVFEGEVETFADLPETIGDPPVGSSYLVRTSTGVWLVNKRQSGIWIRKNNTGVRATDWEYGGDYPVTSVAGRTGAVTLASADITDATSSATADTIVKRGGDGAVALETLFLANLSNSKTSELNAGNITDDRVLYAPDASGTISLEGHGTRHNATGSDPIYNEMVAITGSGNANVNGYYYLANDGGDVDYIKIGSRRRAMLVFTNSRWNIQYDGVTQYQSEVRNNSAKPWQSTTWTNLIGSEINPVPTVEEANVDSVVDELSRSVDFITPTSRTISAGTGLTGGGDLTANRTLSVSYGSSNPAALGTASVGASNDVSRADHTHSAEVSDSAFRVLGSTDSTKKVAIEVDTNVPANTTVTLTAPSSGGTIALAGAAPSAHAASHFTGGTDAITPTNISAQWAEVVSSIDLYGNTLLPSGRNRRILILTTTVSCNLDLPYANNQDGDKLTLWTADGSGLAGIVNVRRPLRVVGGVPQDWETLVLINAPLLSYTFVYGVAGGWLLRLVDTHTHPASAISDSTAAGRALLTAASVQAQRDALDVFVGVANFASLPTPGVTVSAGGSVYVTNDNGKVWVWNGSAYTEISPNTHTRAGSNNTFVNDTALASASLSGPNNCAVGTNALNVNTTGGQNTAIGATALQYNATASYNTGIGFEAMSANAVTGDFNTGIGIQACKNNSSGAQNTACGAGALRDNATSSNNTAVGFTALIGATGAGNTAIGSQAGDSVTSGSSNTIVGSSADVQSGGRSLCVVLGAGAVSPALDGTLAIGGTSGSAMSNLTTSTAPTGATSYLRIWLNGQEYRIAIQTP